MTASDGGLFAITRDLCAEHHGDIEKIKGALYLRGHAANAVARVIFEMRKEGALVRAEKPMTGQQRYLRDARAGVMHLIDIKRAGHNSRDTEFSIPSDGHLSATELRTRRLSQEYSLYGSQGAMCAELGSKTRWP